MLLCLTYITVFLYAGNRVAEYLEGRKETCEEKQNNLALPTMQLLANCALVAGKANHSLGCKREGWPAGQGREFCPSSLFS